jgi:glycosyltransferase involved in cell wall biosynthesis
LARNIREGNVVVGNSRHMARLLQEQLGLNAELVYDGIDRRYFFPGEREHGADRLRVLFAGSLRPYKRAHLLVQQAARWPGVEFCLAGRGEEEERCRNLVAELGCKNVRFLAHLTQPQVGEEMRRADLFFFPSVIEGHPQVLGQAAACGLPVVAMDVYHPDFVIDGTTGFLASSDDELGQKLDLLLTDSGVRSKMRQAAIVHAQQFDWDSVTARWAAIFEAAVATRHKG